VSTELVNGWVEACPLLKAPEYSRTEGSQSGVRGGQSGGAWLAVTGHPSPACHTARDCHIPASLDLAQHRLPVRGAAEWGGLQMVHHLAAQEAGRQASPAAHATLSSSSAQQGQMGLQGEARGLGPFPSFWGPPGCPAVSALGLSTQLSWQDSVIRESKASSGWGLRTDPDSSLLLVLPHCLLSLSPEARPCSCPVALKGIPDLRAVVSVPRPPQGAEGTGGGWTGGPGEGDQAEGPDRDCVRAHGHTCASLSGPAQTQTEYEFSCPLQ
jgi:hypothetical protein